MRSKACVAWLLSSSKLMGRLRGGPRRESTSPIELAVSLEAMKLQEVTNTPRRPTRLPNKTPTTRKIPVSARTPGLDGDAWQRVAERDISEASSKSTVEDDDSWLVADNDVDDLLDNQSIISISDDEAVTPKKKKKPQVVVDLVDDSEDSEEDSEEDDASAIFGVTTPRKKKSADDLTAPTPRKVAAAFAKDREAALRRTFHVLDTLVAAGELKKVSCSWSKRLRTTAGLTRLRREKDENGQFQRIAKIELSTKVIDNQRKLDSTLAHELCHAAAWVIDGTCKPPHGPAFQRWARKVHSARDDIKVTTRHRYAIHFAFQWRCADPDCSYLLQRHSNSVNLAAVSCPRCASSLVRLSHSSPPPTAAKTTTRKKK